MGLLATDASASPSRSRLILTYAAALTTVVGDRCGRGGSGTSGYSWTSRGDGHVPSVVSEPMLRSLLRRCDKQVRCPCATLPASRCPRPRSRRLRDRRLRHRMVDLRVARPRELLPTWFGRYGVWAGGWLGSRLGHQVAHLASRDVARVISASDPQVDPGRVELLRMYRATPIRLRGVVQIGVPPGERVASYSAA